MANFEKSYFENREYWHAMDKASAMMYDVGGKSLGISTIGFEKQLEALQARVREGARNVEINIMGSGRGSIQGNITPEMHSMEEREEMRQLAKINDINVTVHASANTIGLAGASQEGNFSDQLKEQHINEIKKAIDFAADIAAGGPITVHTGEFVRPAYGIEKEEKWKKVLTGYPEEAEKRITYLVNQKTGRLIKDISENEIMWKPVYEEDENHNPITLRDSQGIDRFYLDPITGKKVTLKLCKQNPETGEIELKPTKFKEFREQQLVKHPDADEGKIIEKFYKEWARSEVEHAAGQSGQFEHGLMEKRKDYEILVKQLAEAKEVEKKLSPAQLEEWKKKFTSEIAPKLPLTSHTRTVLHQFRHFPDISPSEYLQDTMREVNKSLQYTQEIAAAQRKSELKLRNELKETRPLQSYALERTADSIARLGIFTYDREKKMAEAGTKLKKDMFISMENVFPEHYGAHPDELHEIVMSARKKMIEDMSKAYVEKPKEKWDAKEHQYIPDGVEKVKNPLFREVSPEKAAEIAENKIRATFDLSHLNLWRKYFQGTEEEFREWCTEKVKKMFKDNVLGHVHISDNFGYEDEHLAVGSGNAPIHGLVKEIRKGGYKGPMIVEWGAQGKGRTHEALLGAMRSLNSPVYKIDGASQSWSNIEHGYFGRAVGPPYVVGAYAPDVDLPTEHRTWTLWSGVPLE